jgi:AcrR family transcriptional regulator
MEATAAMDAEILAEHDAHAGDGGAKRRQIMDGARTVFHQQGFDGASMNDIAQAAGVSKGTLYAYFDSKEQLFETLIREERATQAERTCVFPGDETDPATALATYGRRLVAKIISPEMLAQARVVVAAAPKFPRLGRAFYEAGPLYGVRLLAERLDRFVAAGKLAVDDTERAARQFIDLCTADTLKRVLFAMVDTVTAEEIESTVDAAVAMFLRAYPPPPG